MAHRQSITFSLSVTLVLLTASMALIASRAGAAYSHLSRPHKGTNLMLAAVCTRTDYPALCMSLARSTTRNRPVTVAGVAKQAIMVTIVKTKQARALADKLMAASARDPMQQANLKVCGEVYKDALSNLSKSTRNLKGRSIADLKINLSAALTDYMVCEDGFSQTPGAKSPLRSWNSLLSQFASNNLALASSPMR
ncbi:21 kDa protein-like [Magnolia sinica]|uniref:21 kDa protein-like n=1 Tax=Magnolia sinica TaxID=86752 RepID=UPI002658C241|nr:21 kDa protein-like [Magnolia sinica]